MIPLLLVAALVIIALLAGLAWACLACAARADRAWDALSENPTAKAAAIELMRERER